MNLKTINSIKKFSIAQASGRQYFFEPAMWYDLNKVSGQEEDIIKICRILLHKNDNEFLVGKPCLKSKLVLGNLVQNFRGKKICILKFKAKKKYTRKKGFRASLSRILIRRVCENLET